MSNPVYGVAKDMESVSTTPAGETSPQKDSSLRSE